MREHLNELWKLERVDRIDMKWRGKTRAEYHNLFQN